MFVHTCSLSNTRTKTITITTLKPATGRVVQLIQRVGLPSFLPNCSRTNRWGQAFNQTIKAITGPARARRL